MTDQPKPRDKTVKLLYRGRLIEGFNAESNATTDQPKPSEEAMKEADRIVSSFVHDISSRAYGTIRTTIALAIDAHCEKQTATLRAQLAAATARLRALGVELEPTLAPVAPAKGG